MYTDGLLEPGAEDQSMKTHDDLLRYIQERKDLVKYDPELLLDSIVKDFGKDTRNRPKDDVAIIMVRKR